MPYTYFILPKIPLAFHKAASYEKEETEWSSEVTCFSVLDGRRYVVDR